MKSCWNRTPSLRPQASEVVELLTNNTRLIQPCVGIPLSSIQIEGSNSLDLQLPGTVTVQIRKSNSSGNSRTGSAFAAKLANLDLGPISNSGNGSCNNSESFCDPLLMTSYPAAHFVTQYITLQHSSAGEYMIDPRDNSSSQV